MILFIASCKSKNVFVYCTLCKFINNIFLSLLFFSSKKRIWNGRVLSFLLLFKPCILPWRFAINLYLLLSYNVINLLVESLSLGLNLLLLEKIIS